MKEENVIELNLDSVLDELKTWWPSETKAVRDLFLYCLSGLPGADAIEDLDFQIDGSEPCLGWKETDLLGHLLMAIQTKDDVKRVINELTETPTC